MSLRRDLRRLALDAVARTRLQQPGVKELVEIRARNARRANTEGHR
jgi:hypothetical protein